jgi:hypothetical protein
MTILCDPDQEIIDLRDRVAVLEQDQRELDDVLLAYVNADLSVGWLPSAKALAAVLKRRLTKL